MKKVLGQLTEGMLHKARTPISYVLHKGLEGALFSKAMRKGLVTGTKNCGELSGDCLLEASADERIPFTTGLLDVAMRIATFRRDRGRWQHVTIKIKESENRRE